MSGSARSSTRGRKGLDVAEGFYLSAAFSSPLPVPVDSHAYITFDLSNGASLSVKRGDETVWGVWFSVPTIQSDACVRNSSRVVNTVRTTSLHATSDSTGISKCDSAIPTSSGGCEEDSDAKITEVAQLQPRSITINFR
ncbi:hypothetical protein VSDG_03723 [Cytospora chrysosperma]|uniref:Uncharacterized protein n=1 Tax=Cytospora chrysosperma TaxID=252740 RepID=A0A423W6H5_CYTCH|nr:hypothetical protein VSDG_03723 [Valsa sordida]